jgi:hypothetical protein
MKTLFACFVGLSLICVSSCAVFVGPKHDNGKHKGWYKNPNNPHNPAHGTTQPGPPKSNGNGNGKKKGK